MRCDFFSFIFRFDAVFIPFVRVYFFMLPPLLMPSLLNHFYFEFIMNISTTTLVKMTTSSREFVGSTAHTHTHTSIYPHLIHSDYFVSIQTVRTFPSIDAHVIGMSVRCGACVLNRMHNKFSIICLQIFSSRSKKKTFFFWFPVLEIVYFSSKIPSHRIRCLVMVSQLVFLWPEVFGNSKLIFGKNCETKSHESLAKLSAFSVLSITNKEETDRLACEWIQWIWIHHRDRIAASHLQHHLCLRSFDEQTNALRFTLLFCCWVRKCQR